MTARSINRVFVIALTDGLADEIQELLTKLGLNIEVKEISLKKYGEPLFQKTVLRQLTSAALEDVDVEEIEYLVAHCPIIVEVLSRPNNKLKWAQCPSAGVDGLFKDIDGIKINPDFVMSRTTGTERGQMMAEYVIGHIVARERKFDVTEELQKQAKFDSRPLSKFRMLSELSLGILGLGSIGLEVARACKAMNMTVWAGVRDERFPTAETMSPHVDHFRPMSKLKELLTECDYLVSILPSTPETNRLLSGDVLEPCKNKKTVLINLGRGDLIDDDSLVHAIRQGWLGGAILDVFNQEPLPKDSPLWTLPGVTITPHVSCLAQVNTKMEANVYVNNLVRYLKGENLIHKVDFSKGY